MTPVNWRLAAPEIGFIVDDAGASALVYDASLADTVDAIAADLPCDVLVRNDLGVHPILPGLTAGERPPVPPPAAVSGSDLALLMYTSGTQGRPKGAMITYGNLSASILSHDCLFGLGPDHVALVAAPLFHIGGINVNFLNTLLKGGTVVLERGFDPGRVLRLVPEHGVTSFFAASVMLRMIADHPGFADADLSPLRRVYCGGAPVSADVVRLYARRGVPVCDGYGMTEATAVISSVGPGEATERIGSSGKPALFVDVRIAGDGGADVPAGTPGEILIKGPNVIREYWSRPDVNGESFHDGWFRTGDVGLVDDQGHLYVVDRLKDMIISGGENIASAEVEQCLLGHPAVADAAVVGKPHEKWGEVPYAYVVPLPAASLTVESLRAHAAERLARFKQPAEIEIVTSLPRNAAGKLLKHELRQKLTTN
jgi:fatty-acyl-CoA synthase